VADAIRVLRNGLRRQTTEIASQHGVVYLGYEVIKTDIRILARVVHPPRPVGGIGAVNTGGTAGEVGMIEKIRFVETNHANALGKVGLNSVAGECVFFGDDAVALVEASTPELRAGIPGNFGRFKSVAWIGVLAMALIWNVANAGKAKVLHFGSA